MSNDEGLKGRVTRQSEEAIGKLAQELLENPVVSRRAVAGVRDARAGVRAQEVAMGALNLPVGERPGAAHPARAQRLAAARGHRGRARPARAAHAERRPAANSSALEDALGAIEADAASGSRRGSAERPSPPRQAADYGRVVGAESQATARGGELAEALLGLAQALGLDPLSARRGTRGRR